MVKLGQIGSAFLLSVVLARVLGAEQYGIYAFCLSIVSFIAIPSQLGLPPLVVRETAKSRYNLDWGLISGLWKWANGYVLKLSVTLLLLAVLFFYLGGESIGLSAETIKVLLVGLFVAPIIALAKIRGASLQGLSKVVLGQLPESVVQPCLMILAMVIVYCVGADVENAAFSVMVFHLVTACVAFIFGALVLRKYSPKGINEVPPRYEQVMWRRSVLPLALIGGVQLINGQFDIIMLGFMRSNGEVGVYRVVSQLGALVVFALSAVTMVLQPSFAKLHEKKDAQALQRLVVISARIIFILALVPAVLYYYLGEWLLETVFGYEYKIGYFAVLILAVGQLCNAVVGSVGALLNMTGFERDSLKGLVAGLCFNVVGNLVLIPVYGINGAAVATAGSVVILNIVLWSFVRKRLGINSFAFSNSARLVK
jgi:O-antigen/teichoic acid export membrane protein